MTNDSSSIPPWETADLPEPKPLSWRNWTRFVGPGIVMMGIQIGGGEWLLGPDVTARYGGGLMWIATVAIILQVFYNLECGRYALYCGEPIFTGMMRTRPGPRFWMGVVLLLSFGSIIPGLSTHAAAMAASLWLGEPPGAQDRWLVMGLAYLFLFLVALPVLIGGKIYNMLQAIMTLKVVVVLGFCIVVGVLFVQPYNWWNIFSGFATFGNVPTVVDGREVTVNVFQQWLRDGTLPAVALSNIALLGAFAGYAGGGGLSNATYSNFVRDKGWGMGSVVGAIPSAIGGRAVTLSHVGKVFPINADNLRKWGGWWRYVLIDQVLVWGPGCFMGMALPALLSMEFANFSPLADKTSALAQSKSEWAQALITADGVRHYPVFGAYAHMFWIVTVLVGMLVMLPSQMSIVDDFSRRWTDMLWSGSRRIRSRLSGNQARRVYYSILGCYVAWTFVCAFVFSHYGTPKLMTLVIPNLGNVAIGGTALHLLWINCTRLPPEIRPRLHHRIGLALCAVFYLGISLLVFVAKILPALRDSMGA